MERLQAGLNPGLTLKAFAPYNQSMSGEGGVSPEASVSQSDIKLPGLESQATTETETRKSPTTDRQNVAEKFTPSKIVSYNQDVVQEETGLTVHVIDPNSGEIVKQVVLDRGEDVPEEQKAAYMRHKEKLKINLPLNQTSGNLYSFGSYTLHATTEFNPASLMQYEQVVEGSNVFFVDTNSNRIVATASVVSSGFDRSKLSQYTQKIEGGFRIYVDPSTGKEVGREPAGLGAGIFGERFWLRVANFQQARKRVMGQIKLAVIGDVTPPLGRPRRSAYGALVAPEIERDLINTIRAELQIQVPVVTETEAKELEDMVKAHFHLHNASARSAFGIAEFGGSVESITPGQLRDLLTMPGTREALVELRGNLARRGGYFRGDDPFYSEASIKGRLTPAAWNVVGTWDRYGIANGVDYINVIFDVARKFCDVTGESTRLRGIIMNAPAGTVPPVVILNTFEEYARFYEDRYDDINHLATRGDVNNPKEMSDLFFNPSRLSITRPGRAEYLRRFSYLWINSYIIHYREFTGKDRTILDVADEFAGRVPAAPLPGGPDNDHYERLVKWASYISKAEQGRPQWNEKGDESLLNLPFINPDAIKTENSLDDNAMSQVMKNYLAVAATFEAYLREDMKSRARAHVLKGVLRYLNSQSPVRDNFMWAGWNEKIRANVLTWALNRGLMRPADSSRVWRQLRWGGPLAPISTILAELQVGFYAAWPHLKKGLLEFIDQFFSLITQGKLKQKPG